MVICLEQGADLHMAQLMPLLLTVSCFSRIKIDLPFWYQLTWIVPEKGPSNGFVHVCVCVCDCNAGDEVLSNLKNLMKGAAKKKVLRPQPKLNADR